MQKLTSTIKLPLGEHTIAIQESNSGKILVSETHRCDGFKIERSDLSKFKPNDRLLVDGFFVGELIQMFKE